jgi:hypothetical protein
MLLLQRVLCRLRFRKCLLAWAESSWCWCWRPWSCASSCSLEKVPVAYGVGVGGVGVGGVVRDGRRGQAYEAKEVLQGEGRRGVCS